MPTADLGDVSLYYDTFGQAEDPTILLVAGLGTQVLFWEDEFCQGLVDRAFHVVRFDNRDVGLSTRFDDQPINLGESMAAIGRGEPVVPPYTLGDMAADTAALIEHLGIGPCHVLGASLGGMIAQELAIGHPRVVKSLALLSSTSGESDVGQPTAEAAVAITAPAADGREATIEQNVASRHIWSTEAHWDEDWTRDYFGRAYDRAPVQGGDRQMLAVLTAASRTQALGALSLPALVMHGDQDKLIDPSGGERLAELIADAEHLVLEGMSHDLPPHYWSQVIEGLTRLAIRSL